MQSQIVSQYRELRSSGGTFDDFRKRFPAVATADLLQVIAEDQRSSPGGEFRSLQWYLELVPELGDDSESVLEGIYSEWLILEERGESIALDGYLDAFPELADAIERQWQLHEALRLSDSVLKQPFDPAAARTPELKDESTVGERRATPPPPKFDDLVIECLAGRGGMGAVFRARSDTLDRPVAVKVLSRSVEPNSPEARRMEREARVVARLDHPNIVTVYDVRRDDRELPVILMEYVAGGTLAKKLSAGPMTPRDAAALLEKVAGGLAVAHQSDLIHRDLKPANILLTQTGEPKVADFGLARAISPGSKDATAPSQFVGTPSYVSPEQARAEPEAVNTASDVFSLGVILYEMLTGRPPFQAATAWEIVSDILNEDATPVRQLNRRVPVDLETITHHCLERSIDRRYANAAELQADLRRFLDGRPIAARPTSIPVRAFKWVRRNPALFAALSLIAVTLSGTAFIAVFSRNRVQQALSETSVALDQAARQRDVAVKAMNDLVYTVHDELQTREASVEARGAVLRSAMSGLERVLESDPDDLKTRLTMADAENRYAYILSQQSRNEEARVQYEKALDRVAQLEGKEARTLDGLIKLNLGTFCLRMAKMDEAIQHYLDSLTVTESMLATYPADIDLRKTRCQSQAKLAATYGAKGDFASASKYSQDALPNALELLKELPDDLQLLFLASDLQSSLASNLALQGRSEEAAIGYQQVLDRLAILNPPESEDVQLRTTYFNAMMQLGILELSARKYEDALAKLKDVEQAYWRLIDVEPNRIGFRLRMGGLQLTLMGAAFAVGEKNASIEHGRESIKQLSLAIEMNPSAEIQRSQISAAWSGIAELKLREGDLEAAQSALDEMVENLEPLVERFQMQALFRYCEEWNQLVRAVRGEETELDPATVSRAKRSLAVMQKACAGDFQSLNQDREILLADSEATVSPNVKLLLTKWYAVSLGELYQQQMKRNAEPEVLAETAKQCIDAIREHLQLENADQSFPVLDAAFLELRETELFLVAFP
ncbi:MAG: protein kinase [Planctomycetota bacterium]